MLIRMTQTVSNGSHFLELGNVVDVDRAMAERLIAMGAAVLAAAGDTVTDLGGGIVLSSAAPNNGDGRPNGTIYIQTA